MDKRVLPAAPDYMITRHLADGSLFDPVATRVAGLAYPPVGPLQVSIYLWPVDTAIHRIHSAKYKALQFNNRDVGNARFSPIKDSDGNVIPTIYGGTTFECAAMETIFHDVPYTGGDRQVALSKLHNQVYSTLRCTVPLRLASLRGSGLYMLGVDRSNLIDTEATQYAITRQWAVAIYEQYPQIQGLCWTSRRDDSAVALVLFEDRLTSTANPSFLVQEGDSISLLEDPVIIDRVYDLADDIRVVLFPDILPPGI